ncbi:winged helix-turn-helix domain-containing protein [Actinophytocola sp.]|uniref:winged helix-turn-helix domain-containing protein n=1 Tax=Actinophytocola sp. TaxID=1872138 RepID=UPI00389A399C
MPSREEIAAQLRERIVSGEYEVGAKMPSSREIVADLGGSRMTASAALHLLAEEGLVTIKDKSGAVVRASKSSDKAPDAQLADARRELLAIRDDVADVRKRLDDVTQRVTEALTKLGP